MFNDITYMGSPQTYVLFNSRDTAGFLLYCIPAWQLNRSHLPNSGEDEYYSSTVPATSWAIAPPTLSCCAQ